MKRSLLLIALLGIMVVVGLAVVVMPTQAQPPLHGHILVQRLEFNAAGDLLVGFNKCVDLAANQALRLNAHHAHIHTGGTGVSFGGESGHAVAPVAPLTPWTDCADFETYLPLPVN